MTQAGILTEDDNVELLEGRISPKMTQNPYHSATVTLVCRSLNRRIPQEAYHLRVQMPITARDSSPEPDVAVVRGAEEDYLQTHPVGENLGLVVEVADNSLSRDRYKGKIYAQAGVPHYWIVNLIEHTVEIYSNPTISENPHYERGYRFTRGETVEIMIFDEISLVIPVDEFLKPQ